MTRRPRALPRDAWPTATENTPLAHLSTPSDDLKADEIPFYDVDGDRMAVVELDQGLVWLVDLPGGRPGITVMAPQDEEAAVISELVEFLGLDDDAVEWRRGDSE